MNVLITEKMPGNFVARLMSGDPIDVRDGRWEKKRKIVEVGRKKSKKDSNVRLSLRKNQNLLFISSIIVCVRCHRFSVLSARADNMYPLVAMSWQDSVQL